MVERFFHHYGELERLNEGQRARLRRRAELLRTLHGEGLGVAVVTNKQHRFASALLVRLGLAGWVDVVVGGDTCARRKPDPQPLLFACESLRAPPADASSVGDSHQRRAGGARRRHSR